MSFCSQPLHWVTDLPTGLIQSFYMQTYLNKFSLKTGTGWCLTSGRTRLSCSQKKQCRIFVKRLCFGRKSVCLVHLLFDWFRLRIGTANLNIITRQTWHVFQESLAKRKGDFCRQRKDLHGKWRKECCRRHLHKRWRNIFKTIWIVRMTVRKSHPKRSLFGNRV